METDNSPTSRRIPLVDLLYWGLVVWASYNLARSLYEKGKEAGLEDKSGALSRARMTILELEREVINARKEPSANSDKLPEVAGESAEWNSADQSVESDPESL